MCIFQSFTNAFPVWPDSEAQRCNTKNNTAREDKELLCPSRWMRLVKTSHSLCKSLQYFAHSVQRKGHWGRQLNGPDPAVVYQVVRQCVEFAAGHRLFHCHTLGSTSHPITRWWTGSILNNKHIFWLLLIPEIWRKPSWSSKHPWFKFFHLSLWNQPGCKRKNSKYWKKLSCDLRRQFHLKIYIY